MSYDKRIRDIAAQAALSAGKNASVAPQLLLADIVFTLADAVADGRIMLPPATAKRASLPQKHRNLQQRNAAKGGLSD